MVPVELLAIVVTLALFVVTDVAAVVAPTRPPLPPAPPVPSLCTTTVPQPEMTPRASARATAMRGRVVVAGVLESCMIASHQGGGVANGQHVEGSSQMLGNN